MKRKPTLETFVEPMFPLNSRYSMARFMRSTCWYRTLQSVSEQIGSCWKTSESLFGGISHKIDRDAAGFVYRCARTMCGPGAGKIQPRDAEEPLDYLAGPKIFYHLKVLAAVTVT